MFVVLPHSCEADSEQRALCAQQEVRETRPGVSLEAYRPFFRELDLEVLSLLSRPLLEAERSTKVGLHQYPVGMRTHTHTHCRRLRCV